MKLTLKTAKALNRLTRGEILPGSAARGKLIDQLVAENILYRKGKHRKTLHLLDQKGLALFLANQLQINDLSQYIAAKENEGTSRADFVKLTTDSKDAKERVFQGFLVNCYSPIEAVLNDKPITLNPAEGSFGFIYAYERFQIPSNITVVGVENAKIFSEIRKQKYLFTTIEPLFISRYPQNQNKDVIRWLQGIPNPYLHFGDFDPAGIGIYLNEYKKHLGNKASFFIPDTIEKALKQHGNRRRYDLQSFNFNPKTITEPRLKQLFKLIQTEKKGLDQEYFIGSG